MSGTRATLRNAGTSLNVTGVRGAAPGPGFLDADSSDDKTDDFQQDGASKAPDDQNGNSGSKTTIGAAVAVGGFSSEHRGSGSNFAFGDGRVKFIPATINQLLLQQLAHRADGKLIGSGEY